MNRKEIYFVNPVHIRLSNLNIMNLDIDMKEIGKINSLIITRINYLNRIIHRRNVAINNYKLYAMTNQNFFHYETFHNKMKFDIKNENYIAWREFYESAIIDTEIFYLYTQTLLNTIAKLLILYNSDLPKKPSNDKKEDVEFVDLYYFIKNNKIKNNNLQDYFLKNMNWFLLTVNMPRNKLTAHDSKSTFPGLYDHDFDFSVSKQRDEEIKNSDDDVEELINIQNNHTGFFQPIPHREYIQPIFREMLRFSGIYSEDELKIMRRIGEKLAIYPYVIDVVSDLQKFFDFVSSDISYVMLNQKKY